MDENETIATLQAELEALVEKEDALARDWNAHIHGLKATFDLVLKNLGHVRSAATNLNRAFDKVQVSNLKAVKLEVVEQLRRTHSIRAALGDFRVDDSQCTIAFKGPGYSADIALDRATGQYEFTETRNGWGAVINDLHKGRDSGHTWNLLIDIAAVLMTAVSLSGLALIFFLPKRRNSGLIALAVGAAVCYCIYSIFVP